MDRKKTGQIGESYAQKYLITQNYRIIKTNYYCRFGELDIIAFDYHTSQLVFVEVKTRKSNAFGPATSALTPYKKHKIIKAALHFLNLSSQKYTVGWRIDLIALQLHWDNRIKKITHIKNI